MVSRRFRVKIALKKVPGDIEAADRPPGDRLSRQGFVIHEMMSPMTVRDRREFAKQRVRFEVDERAVGKKGAHGRVTTGEKARTDGRSKDPPTTFSAEFRSISSESLGFLRECSKSPIAHKTQHRIEKITAFLSNGNFFSADLRGFGSR
jgi:hypothetical protein